MKLHKIELTYNKFVTYLLWTYMALVGFHQLGQPVLSAAVDTPSPTIVTASPYVRKSRDTGGLSPTSAPEGTDGQVQYGSSSSSGTSNGFFSYPSFKHKYQPRVARFHGDYPSTSSLSLRSMTSFPKLNPLAGILGGRSGEAVHTFGRHIPVDNLPEDDSQDPTFTPFISASALSNIPQFFQHLRANLEALQMNEDDSDSEEDSDRHLGQYGDGMLVYGNDDEGRALNIPRPPERPMRWMPATSGLTGRANIRHFVNDPAEQDLFYRKPAYFNPARNAYEFGLG